MTRPFFRLMRLWTNGEATAVWTGYNRDVLNAWIAMLPRKARDGRLWIDVANKPSCPGYGRRT